jgi:hypothetical protein
MEELFRVHREIRNYIVSKVLAHGLPHPMRSQNQFFTHPPTPLESDVCANKGLTAISCQVCANKGLSWIEAFSIETSTKICAFQNCSPTRTRCHSELRGPCFGVRIVFLRALCVSALSAFATFFRPQKVHYNALFTKFRPQHAL